MEKQTHRSTWIAVSVGIAGLVLGYSFVIAQTPIDIFARANSCPLRHTEETCNCADPAQCQTGECDAHKV